MQHNDLATEIQQFNKLQKYNFIPLEINFKLRTPVMVTYPWINFDGIIAYSSLEEIFGDLNVFPSMIPLEIINTLQLPIEKVYFNNDKDFFYKSSISRFNNSDIGSKSFYKHFPSEGLEFLKTKKTKYKLTGGPFKLYMKTLVTITASECRFWCNGDYNKINQYCNGLVGLGKKVSSGNGIISSAAVSKIKNDYSIFHEIHGLNRPVPTSYRKMESDIANISYKPPYWSKMNHTLCYIPGDIYE